MQRSRAQRCPTDCVYITELKKAAKVHKDYRARQKKNASEHGIQERNSARLILPEHLITRGVNQVLKIANT
jgi:hypothetical protein